MQNAGKWPTRAFPIVGFVWRSRAENSLRKQSSPRRESTVSSSSVLAWQNHVHNTISHKMGLPSAEQEEIQLLKQKADRLRDFRKKFLREKFD